MNRWRQMIVVCVVWGHCCVCALAGPAKTYTDVSVSNENTDAITDTATYYINRESALNIFDFNSYPTRLTFTNSGDVTLSSHTITSSHFLSLISNHNFDVDLVNTGALTLTFGPNNQTNSFEAIRTPGNLVNYGRVDFDLTHQGILNNIYGVLFYVTGDRLENTGSLRLVARASDVNTNGPSAYSYATGFLFEGDTVVNSGDMVVEAHGASITGSSTFAHAQARGISTKGDLLNTGTIHVAAYGGRIRANSSLPYTAEPAEASGIYVRDSIILDSRGLISVEALLYPGTTGATAQAYQVFVNSGTTTVTGYAMELNTQADFTQTYDGTIKLNSGTALNFNNAVLYLKIGSGFDGRARYEIPMLVEGAATADQFTRLGPVPPEYRIALEDGNGNAPQALTVEFVPENSSPMITTGVAQEMNGAIHGMVGENARAGVMSDILTGLSSPLSRFAMVDPSRPPGALMAGAAGVSGVAEIPLLSTGDRVFVTPVALVSRNSHATKGFKARDHGILAGVTRKLGEGFHLGAHAGVGRMDVDYTGQGYEYRSEGVDRYSLGLHGVHRHRDWIFTAIAGGFYRRSDYEDLSPVNRETAEYDAVSFRVDALAGRLWRRGDHFFLPELGLAYVLEHREAFTTENLSAMDVAYGGLTAHELYGRFGGKYFVRLPLPGEWQGFAYAGGEVTQALSDAEASHTMQVGQIAGRVKHRGEKTVVNPKAGVMISTGAWEMVAGYGGGFTDDQQNHLFWLQWGFRF